MGSDQPTLVEYLLAKISAEEAEAAEIASYIRADLGERIEVRLTRTDCEARTSESKYFTPYDPVRVLADCAARRAIIAEHPDDGGYCRRCAGDEAPPDWSAVPTGVTVAIPAWGMPWPCITLRLLAAPYVADAGFNPDWVVE